jgi:hypothetical protein
LKIPAIGKFREFQESRKKKNGTQRSLRTRRGKERAGMQNEWTTENTELHGKQCLYLFRLFLSK